jgi:hypothetical protein
MAHPRPGSGYVFPLSRVKWLDLVLGFKITYSLVESQYDFLSEEEKEACLRDQEVLYRDVWSGVEPAKKDGVKKEVKVAEVKKEVKVVEKKKKKAGKGKGKAVKVGVVEVEKKRRGAAVAAGPDYESMLKNL